MTQGERNLLIRVEYLFTFDFGVPSNVATNHLLNIKFIFAAFLEKSEGMALPTFGQGMSAFPGFAVSPTNNPFLLLYIQTPLHLDLCHSWKDLLQHCLLFLSLIPSILVVNAATPIKAFHKELAPCC